MKTLKFTRFGQNIRQAFWIALLGLTFCTCESPEKTKQTAQKKVANPTFNTVSQTVEPKKPKNTLQLKNLFADSIKKVFEKKLAKKQILKIVCYGNSITNGYKVRSNTIVGNPYPHILESLLRKHYQNDSIQVIKEGKNGRRSDQAFDDLDKRVLIHNPDIVILEFGINDAYSNFSPAFFRKKMWQIIEKLQKRQITVLVASPTPVISHKQKQVWELTQTLHLLCQEKNIAFVNLYESIQFVAQKENIAMISVLPDKIHFADHNYEWIADIIFEYLKE